MRRAPAAAAVLAAVAALPIYGRRAAPIALALVGHVHAAGVWAPVAFVGVYAAAVVALVPGSILTLAGGALFGFWPALLCVSAGAVLGSTAAFLIGRYIARDAVERWLVTSRKVRGIDAAVRRDGARIVLLLRLSPVMPFNVLNYALGASNIRMRDFMAGALGMLPATVVYVYAGKVAGEALAVSGQAAVPHNASYYLVLMAGLAATIAATVVVTRTARRAIIDASL